MGALDATWSVFMSLRVPTHSTAMTEPKGTEQSTLWSRTPDGRGEESRLAFRRVSFFPIANGVPAYKLVHVVLATMFFLVRLHGDAVRFVMFHVVLVLCQHSLNTHFVIRLVP